MENKFLAIVNLIVGMLNLGVAITSDAPKWFTLVCIGVSFFIAGFFFGDDD